MGSQKDKKRIANGLKKDSKRIEKGQKGRAGQSKLTLNAWAYRNNRFNANRHKNVHHSHFAFLCLFLFLPELFAILVGSLVPDHVLVGGEEREELTTQVRHLNDK